MTEMTAAEMPSVLSGLQRRCQTLLMFYLSEQHVTPESICRINSVDKATTFHDVADIRREIRHHHHLNIVMHAHGGYRMEGSILNLRLCLLLWLRRSLRHCPHFIDQHFTPFLKARLKQAGISRILYDDTNLHALINRCGQNLQCRYDNRDMALLRLYLQYCLLQQSQNIPTFNAAQRCWAQESLEYQVATEITHHWQRRTRKDAHPDECLFLALLFMMLKVPNPQRDLHVQEVQLYRAVNQLIDHFQQLSGYLFANRSRLRDQLYVHIAQAINRALFEIGIDDNLPEDIQTLYPRLMRTTQAILPPFEAHYGLRFSRTETGLIAMIFGAWLMQENDLQEKQVLLLTGNNTALEQEIERQLRELTLLPLNIKYQTLDDFQHKSVPKGIALVITPYALSLPLFSPPLIHATEPLSTRQQRHICQMLEVNT